MTDLTSSTQSSHSKLPCLESPPSGFSKGFRARFKNTTTHQVHEQEERKKTPPSQLIDALRRCIKKRDLGAGRKLHLHAIAVGFHTHKYVASLLISMYSKCREMALARQVFETTASEDIVLWNSLMLGYVHNGEGLVALELFTAMDCEPDSVTYVAVLKACGSLASDQKKSDKNFCLQKGIEIHKRIRDRGFGSGIVVTNTLISMYSKCGSMRRAREVFDGMIRKDPVTWACLLCGYVENWENRLALELFSTSIQIHKLESLNSAAVVAVIKACGNLAVEEDQNSDRCWLDEGIAIHKRVKDRRLDSSLVVATSLVEMYSKCRSMFRAREVFDGMVERDVVAWTTLINGYVENGESLIAMELFTRMEEACEAEADLFTYVSLLKACAALASDDPSRKKFCLAKGIAFHEEIEARCLDSDHKNVVLATALVDMYGKCGAMDLAREVFDGMVSKDVIAWNCLMSGYVENELSSEAMKIFAALDCQPNFVSFVAVLKACRSLASDKESSEMMKKKKHCLGEGISIHKRVKDCGLESHIAVATGLVEMYSRCGRMQCAREVFDGVLRKDVVLWNCVMSGYAENGESLEALEFFDSMDCQPNPITYLVAIKACGDLVAASTGSQGIHGGVCRAGAEQDQVVMNSLIDLYVKCGDMSRAQMLFDDMRSPDVVSWNTLMAGYASLGESSRVFDLAKKMQQGGGVEMDDITFTCVLTACSRAGLLEEGRGYFELMLKRGICAGLEHYNCMVDMLGRHNRVEEALYLVRSMPMEGNAVTWTTLLWACKKWKNEEVGKVAFDELVAKSTEASAYVLMSDILKT